jgi:hypothetical protein|tara:strand:+ start:1343 stop:1894 length:552 start_codon:yes stop_codon:yes gene_type:complete
MPALSTSRPKKLRLLPLTVLITAAATTLYGCNQYQRLEQAKIEPCDAIDKLVADHSNNFADIRIRPRPFNSITIWQTDYEVIQDRCEIWGWGSGKFNYVCSIVSPTKDVAATRYHDSVKRVKGCLNSNWVATENPRQVGNGVHTRFIQANNPTTVSLHLVETPGVFSSEWTTYASVGNYSDKL